MAQLRMSELPTTHLAPSDALQRKQVLRKLVSTRIRSSENDWVGAGVRMLRVLVVAAEQGSSNAILRQVRYAGHGAHAAPDGLAALRVAAVWNPDVVLLDIETPLMDECQIARHLRCEYLGDDCLIIAFSQWIDDARRKPCVEAGIDLLLGKPVDHDVVETLLMLECVHVNWGRAGELVNDSTLPGVDGPSTYPHSE